MERQSDVRAVQPAEGGVGGPGEVGVLGGQVEEVASKDGDEVGGGAEAQACFGSDAEAKREVGEASVDGSEATEGGVEVEEADDAIVEEVGGDASARLHDGREAVVAAGVVDAIGAEARVPGEGAVEDVHGDEGGDGDERGFFELEALLFDVVTEAQGQE